MKHLSLIIGLCLFFTFSLSGQDWLIDGSSYKTTTQTTHEGKRLELTNGLLRRTFLLAPNAATIALDNLMTGQNELRAVRPEAQLVINGKEYPVGGLTGQPVNNFLTEDFINHMLLYDSAFTLIDYQIGESKARFPWKANGQWISNLYPWPAPGKRITFNYQAPATAPLECKDLKVRVIYELYDGAPILAKWIEIDNKGTNTVTLDSFKSEILALVETAPKVHYGEPHEVRMMAQESGTYTKDFRKKTRSDGCSTRLHRPFHPVIRCDRLCNGRRHGSDEGQPSCPLGI